MKIKTLFSAAILHTAFLFPATHTWNVNGSGNWSTPSTNWTPAGPPALAGDQATFGPQLAAPTVTVDIATIVVGTLSFTNTAPAYTIAAASTNTLALQGSAGTAAITNAAGVTSNNIISTPLVLMNPLTITQSSGTNPLTISGAMSGSTSVTNAGSGIIVFSGANIYTGGTTVTTGELDLNATGTLPAAGALTISGGIVKCNAVNALPSTGTITLSGGTLNLNNLNQTAGPITGTSNITLGSASLTSTTTTTTSYSGVIGGTGGFTLAGSGGMLTFATNQTYSGGTTVSGSTLVLNPGITLFSGGSLTVHAPGMFHLNNNTQTVGLIAGTGSIVLGSGALTTNAAAPSTFAGVISGTGTFTQAGTSTLTFTGMNTYTGGTTISGGALGTLQLGVNNALAPTAPVTIGANNTLDMTPAASTVQAIGPLTSALSNTSLVNLGATQLTINSTASSSFGGIISGSGSLIAAGPQTLTLTNSNTYTGGTTVNGGILQLSPAGLSNALAPTGSLTINSLGTVILNNNTGQTITNLNGNGSLQLGSLGFLTVNPTSTSLFSGPITGLGGVIVGGSTPLILTGTNSYAGGTAVNGGAALQGTTTSLQGSITNNGDVIFDQTFSGAFSGNLTGGGSLLINGGGSVIFNTSQMAISTDVTAGELIILNPATLTSNVTIESGGALSGNGIVSGVVNNNGMLLLDLNTFTIEFDYNQNVGSFFNVDVTPSSSGLLNVTMGAVAITSPATMEINVSPGIYAANTLYTLITSGVAPVAGTFSPPVFNNPFFQGTLIYNQGILPGTVQLLLGIVPFSNVIKGGNAGAIAKCINPQAFPSESELLPLINNLIFLPIEEVRSALNEIQPSQLKALGLTEENNLVVIRSSLSQHMNDFYKTECSQAVSELYKWNVWGNFSGDFLRQEGQRENVGYSADTAAATVGIDAAVAKDLFLGIAGAYDYTWLDWSSSRGHATISSYYVGPYFSWFNRRVFTNLSLLATWNRYNASRHIFFPNIDVHAKSNHNGHGLIGHFDLGVILYPTAGMTFNPIAGVDYIHLREQGYTEQGANGLNMKILPTHASLFRTELGLEIAKCAILAHNKWTHDLKLSWIHQFPLKGKHFHAQFAEVDCTYTVQGLQPNQDYLDIATGLTGLFMKNKLSAALRYEGKFGDGIRDNTGYVQLTYRF
jgi:autotransporter-associated beta strand protein